MMNGMEIFGWGMLIFICLLVAACGTYSLVVDAVKEGVKKALEEYFGKKEV